VRSSARNHARREGFCFGLSGAQPYHRARKSLALLRIWWAAWERGQDVREEMPVIDNGNGRKWVYISHLECAPRRRWVEMPAGEDPRRVRESDIDRAPNIRRLTLDEVGEIEFEHGNGAAHIRDEQARIG
jgi:hypothetical protein